MFACGYLISMLDMDTLFKVVEVRAFDEFLSLSHQYINSDHENGGELYSLLFFANDLTCKIEHEWAWRVNVSERGCHLGWLVSNSVSCAGGNISNATVPATDFPVMPVFAAPLTTGYVLSPYFDDQSTTPHTIEIVALGRCRIENKYVSIKCHSLHSTVATDVHVLNCTRYMDNICSNIMSGYTESRYGELSDIYSLVMPNLPDGVLEM